MPTLQPLEKTGAQEAIRSEPSTRQDESGAVTLAQGPLGERPRVDTPSPSVPLDVADEPVGRLLDADAAAGADAGGARRVWRLAAADAAGAAVAVGRG